jgi:hypothetical protein
MPSSSHGLPRVYEDVDDVDDVNGFGALEGTQQAVVYYSGGTLLMLGSPGPLQGSVARRVFSNAPGQVRIVVAPPPKALAPARPTRVEWAVAVSAGLFAAALIGVLAFVV